MEMKMIKHKIIGMALVLSFALLAGCERNSSHDGTNLPAARPATQSTANKDNSARDQAAPDAAMMAHIPAGKFIMGDKDEVDAPPHEIAVSAFVMDKHLV